MLKRDEALKLLADQGTPAPLLQHALAAEAIMRALARRFGEDEALWGLTGLLHDLDYPSTAEAPERHGLESAELLSGKLPEEALAAMEKQESEARNLIATCTRAREAAREAIAAGEIIEMHDMTEIAFTYP